MSTYRIKPLVWEECFDDIAQQFTATTRFGSYCVERWMDESNSEWGPWKWHFYFEEGAEECENSADGKAKAEAHWRAQLEQCLESTTAE